MRLSLLAGTATAALAATALSFSLPRSGGAVEAAHDGHAHHGIVEVRQAAQQGRRAGQAARPAVATKYPEMTVYKSPSCGCCKAWVEHVRAAGFTVKTRDTDDLAPIKQSMGTAGKLESCHTAVVGGYVVEGHVPADLIARMLREKPAIAGLAVPGMPMGSPGMEVPDGTKDAYEVIAFDRKGKRSVYARR